MKETQHIFYPQAVEHHDTTASNWLNIAKNLSNKSRNLLITTNMNTENIFWAATIETLRESMIDSHYESILIYAEHSDYYECIWPKASQTQH